MKTTSVTIAALSLLSLTSGQPHGRRHAHEHEHDKKDVVVIHTTIVKTVNAHATALPAGNVIVYVKANGERTTVTERMFQEIPTPAPVPQQKTSATQPAESLVPQVKQENNAGSGSGGSPPTAAGSGFGFSYAPFKSGGGCKDVDEVKKDFADIGKEYSLVRIYGTGCSQVETVLAAAKEHNLKIFAGIFDINQVEAEANLIIEAGENDWDRFDTISIGNEVVNFAPEDQKAAKAIEVVDAIAKAKKLLGDAGYKGKIVTVDTLVASRAHPSICAAGDYCAVNCHPFFDGNVAAAGAGKFVTEQVETLRKVIPNGQKVVVTETGWPWKGSSNGPAIPSLENQEVALGSIKNTFNSKKSEVILFTIYNDHWKTNTAAQFGAEQFWGFKGLDAPSG